MRRAASESFASSIVVNEMASKYATAAGEAGAASGRRRREWRETESVVESRERVGSSAEFKLNHACVTPCHTRVVTGLPLRAHSSAQTNT